MPDLDPDIRRGLARLSDNHGTRVSMTLDDLAARRGDQRRQRRRRLLLASVPVVLGFGLVVRWGAGAVTEDDPTVIAADGPSAQSTATAGPPVGSAVSPVTVLGTKVVGGEEAGTLRVVMTFDGPLPEGGPRHIDDIAAADPNRGIVYTTQEPESVHLCDSLHSFPPPTKGMVDVLIPAVWFAPGDATHTSQLDTIGNPAKFVVCGPHNGFYQYSTMGPLSADLADVAVTLNADRSRLTIAIG